MSILNIRVLVIVSELNYCWQFGTPLNVKLSMLNIELLECILKSFIICYQIVAQRIQTFVLVVISSLFSGNILQYFDIKDKTQKTVVCEFAIKSPMKT